MADPIVIVGAGQSGLQLAESLRKEKYDGDLLLIGDEPHAPYSRPPLSKGLLLGEVTPEQLILRNDAALERKNITLVTNTRVHAVDPQRRVLVLTGGKEQRYHKLALATGGRARTLPIAGVDLPGVHTLRTLDDIRVIQQELEHARSIAVVGGGFIGLEMAAVARKLGKAVTVLEAGERLMGRVVAPMLSDFYADLHRGHGVQLRCGAQVAEILGEQGRVAGVRMGGGETIFVDMVVLGVGIAPNSELADAAGLECEGGIVVDACGRTSDPHIVASGDCAAVRTSAGLQRLESVQNAVEMAKAAAAALMGREKPFTAPPWFWSDQYDVKLQMAGISHGFDHAVTRGRVEQRQFSVYYFKTGRLIAVDSVNAAGDHITARKLLEHPDSHLTPDQFADALFEPASVLA